MDDNTNTPSNPCSGENRPECDGKTTPFTGPFNGVQLNEARAHLGNRREAMAKQADGIELLKLLYHDEAHLTVQADTRHRALRIVLDTFEHSQRLLSEGEQAIHKTIMARIK